VKMLPVAMDSALIQLSRLIDDELAAEGQR
jgi:hypothetical protein